MTSTTPAVPSRRRAPLLFVTIPLLLAAVFFAGWLPTTLELRKTNARLRELEVELRLSNAQRRLGVAAAEARRNNFGLAATEAARFFDETQRLLGDEAFDKRPRLRTGLNAYVQQRDAIMTGLSTNDPATAQLLTDLYLAFEGVRQRGL